MKIKKTQSHTNRGFTLIEVLIAVVIFSTALAGLLMMVGTGIGDVTVAKNRLVANYLAQEGIELMRYKRDYLVATNPTGGWQAFQGLTNGLGTSQMFGGTVVGPFGVSPIRPLSNPVDCGANNPTGCDIVQDIAGSTATAAYTIKGDIGVTNWPATIFTRKIYLETPANNSNDAYIIHSVVTWTEGTGTYSTSMSETIYNWL